MTIKSFTTSAKSAEDNDAPMGVPLDTQIDDYPFTLIPPTMGQWAVTIAGQAESASTSEQMGTQINFFFSLLDGKDVRYFKRRLFDREDPFDIDNVAEIIEWAMEQWSARPTKQPSDFSPPQSSGGKRSTAVRHRSTHSRSASTGS